MLMEMKERVLRVFSLLKSEKEGGKERVFGSPDPDVDFKIFCFCEIAREVVGEKSVARLVVTLC